MLKMRWVDDHHIHKGSLEGAIEKANELYWNLSVAENKGEWFVHAGEDLILKTDSRETVDAFLYGFGLAYGCLPPEIFGELKRQVKELVDP